MGFFTEVERKTHRQESLPDFCVIKETTSLLKACHVLYFWIIIAGATQLIKISTANLCLVLIKDGIFISNHYWLNSASAKSTTCPGGQRSDYFQTVWSWANFFPTLCLSCMAPHMRHVFLQATLWTEQSSTELMVIINIWLLCSSVSWNPQCCSTWQPLSQNKCSCF